jgi:methylthioribose-1-phosphate isomerase
LNNIDVNHAIGQHTISAWQALISRAKAQSRPLQVLTHCNAGALATAAWGTALSGIYQLHEQGVPVHVWVDETRPRNQGASLTSWELSEAGVPHTVIADNVGGLLMQQGTIDVVIVGCDRVAANGDVVNKIGTYLKALAAHAHDVAFDVACPLSTIDKATPNGLATPIELRDSRELTHMRGVLPSGEVQEVQVMLETCTVYNPGFDITPARYVRHLITEQGLVPANAQGISKL